MAASSSNDQAGGNLFAAMNKWARCAVDCCRSLMDFGQNTENNKAELNNVPMDKHCEIFQFASDSVRRSIVNCILKWKNADTATDVLAWGNLLLGTFDLDMRPRLFSRRRTRRW